MLFWNKWERMEVPVPVCFLHVGVGFFCWLIFPFINSFLSMQSQDSTPLSLHVTPFTRLLCNFALSRWNMCFKWTFVILLQLLVTFDWVIHYNNAEFNTYSNQATHIQNTTRPGKTCFLVQMAQQPLFHAVMTTKHIIYSSIFDSTSENNTKCVSFFFPLCCGASPS